MKTQKIIVGVTAEHAAGQHGVIKCLIEFFASHDVSLYAFPSHEEPFTLLKIALNAIAGNGSTINIIKGISCPKELQIIEEYCNDHDIALKLIAITAPARVRFKKSKLFRIYEQFVMHEWFEATETDSSKRNIAKCIEHVVTEARFCNCRNRPRITAIQIFNYLTAA